MVDVRLRPLAMSDIPTASELARVVFEGLARSLDREPHIDPPPEPEIAAERAQVRFGHIIDTTPAGCWAAVGADDELLGVCLAFRRDGLWMLSLLIVAESAQGQGVGGQLLRAGLGVADGATSGVICATRDPRALRRYHGIGFTLDPSFLARGRLDRSLLPAGLASTAADLDARREFCDDLSRRLRGTPHGPDLDALARSGATLLVHDTAAGRGYTFVRDGSVALLAADTAAAAADLAWSALALAGPEDEAVLGWMTGRQQWAIDVGMAARLTFSNSGSLALRGDTGPFSPYLPSGFLG